MRVLISDFDNKDVYYEIVSTNGIKVSVVETRKALDAVKGVRRPKYIGRREGIWLRE